MGMKKHGSKKEALPVENSKKEPQRLTWKCKCLKLKINSEVWVTNETFVIV